MSQLYIYSPAQSVFHLFKRRTFVVRIYSCADIGVETLTCKVRTVTVYNLFISSCQKYLIKCGIILLYYGVKVHKLSKTQNIFRNNIRFHIPSRYNKTRILQICGRNAGRHHIFYIKCSIFCRILHI